MTAWLTWLLGRLPLGWLQLVHKPGRLAAALTGVAFANVLVFMQLGFLGALNEASTRVYGQLDADILIAADDFKTLSDASPLPRERRLRAETVQGVASTAPFYKGLLGWTEEDGQQLTFTVYGIEPGNNPFTGLGPITDDLRLLDAAAMDVRSRNLGEVHLERARQGKLTFELGGRTIRVVDLFESGPGFESDGTLVVSDQTFFHLFPNRSAAAPNHVLVRVEPGFSETSVVRALQDRYTPADRVVVRTLEVAKAADLSYQNTERPTGVIFGFGVIIGVLVGIVIVYQVLATDVADHLAEYATLKAIGYRQRYFLGVVFEESVVLAILGFIPGLLTSLVFYRVVAAATGLPVTMSASRMVGVFFGTLLMCGISGAIATRRLAGADPADLF